MTTSGSELCVPVHNEEEEEVALFGAIAQMLASTVASVAVATR
jgi:hypothetical protein